MPSLMSWLTTKSSHVALLQDTAISSMSIVCASVGNRDIDPFIPSLISSVARPAEVPDCVHKLSATTFVQVCLTIGQSVVMSDYTSSLL